MSKIIIICVLSMFVFASCANLPGKEKSSIPTAVISDGGTGQQDVTAVEPTVPPVVMNNWTAPAEGPTVTPIVLGVEKRGEQAAMISRPDEPAVDYTGGGMVINGQTYSEVPTAVPGSSNIGGLRDAMEVVSYNPVNGAVLLPGQAIHLDITLRNTGTTTWQTTYKVVDYSNIPMAVTKEYNLPYPVAPGGTALLSIYMAAPDKLGSYPENFRIQDAYGNAFGNFDYILTVGDFSYATPIATLTATITPTYYSAEGITATPDSLAWMCIDPERSRLQDCYSFCVEYGSREEFKYCFYDGVRYETPIPVN